MSWVRIDDSAPEHPKFMKLAELAKQGDKGAAAAWLWICGLAYCNRQAARDGFIPRAKVAQLYPVKGAAGLAARLVEVGLWEKRDDGFVIHDYNDYQPSAADTADLSEKRAEAGRKGGRRSAEKRASEASEARVDAECEPSASRVRAECEPSEGRVDGANGQNPEENQTSTRATCLKQNQPPSRPVPSRPVEEIFSLAREAPPPDPAPRAPPAPLPTDPAAIERMLRQQMSQVWIEATGGKPLTGNVVAREEAARQIREAAEHRQADPVVLMRQVFVAFREVVAYLTDAKKAGKYRPKPPGLLLEALVGVGQSGRSYMPEALNWLVGENPTLDGDDAHRERPPSRDPRDRPSAVPTAAESEAAARQRRAGERAPPPPNFAAIALGGGGDA